MVFAAPTEIDVEALGGKGGCRVGTLGGGEDAVQRRPRLGAQERIVDAERVVEESRLTFLVGGYVDIARLDEGIEGRRDLEMGKQGCRIAFEAWRQHSRPAQRGTQTADAIVRTENAQVGRAGIGDQ